MCVASLMIRWHRRGWVALDVTPEYNLTGASSTACNIMPPCNVCRAASRRRVEACWLATAVGVLIFLQRDLPPTSGVTQHLVSRNSLRSALHVHDEQPASSAASVVLPAIVSVAQPAISIIFWNVNTVRKPQIISRMGHVLRGASLIGLCEVPWSESELAQHAQDWGFTHHLLLREGSHRFNMALLSTQPLVLAAAVAPGNGTYFHGALCAVALPALGRLVVCVTHLTPHKPQARRMEARALRRALLPVAMGTAASAHHGEGSGRHGSWPPLLLLGDLNALSSHDAPSHRHSGLAAALAPTKAWRKFSIDERLDYSVLAALTADGATTGGVALTDLQPDAAVGEVAAHSVPTSRGGDSRHAAPMRLDYALASGELLRRCPHASSRIVATEEAGSLSDHYPVEVTMTAECLVTARSSGVATTSSSDGGTSSSAAASAGDKGVARVGDAPVEGDADAADGCGDARRAERFAGLLEPAAVSRCRALSGVSEALHSHRGKWNRGSLGRCAVVGSSGSLLDGAALGAEIDAKYDAVWRLNAAPVGGYEKRAGSVTSVRMVNAPQSSTWARQLKADAKAATAAELPAPVSRGEVLFVSGSASAWKGVEASHGVSVRLLNRTYRKQCVLPLVFSKADHAAHTAKHHNVLTPSFGLEAVAHALHGCAAVDVFGFGVPPSELRPSERDELAAAERRLHLPPAQAEARREASSRPFQYHYWERRTVDPAADDRDKPWTYKSHNFATEAAVLRAMHCAGVLRVR